MSLLGVRARSLVLVLSVAGLLLSTLMMVDGGAAQAQQADSELVCPVGTLQDNQCVEIGDEPVPGPDECPDDNGVLADAAGCFMLVPGVGGDSCPPDTTPDPQGTACRSEVSKVAQGCPDGFTEAPSLEGACFLAEPALQADAVCPSGSRGQAGNCYTVSPQNLLCADGTLAGDVCVIVGAPPVPAGLGCPVGGSVLQDGDECYSLVGRVDGECPAGSVADVASGDCRRPVDLRPTQLVCQQGFGLVDGACIRYATPASGTGCLAGAVLDDFGLCRSPVADRQSALYCASAAQELQGTDCVTTIADQGCGYAVLIAGCEPNPVCPQNFLTNLDFGGRCVRYEPAVQSTLTGCPEGARGTTGACYILVAKGPSDGGLAQCPVGSIEDGAADCRKPVANVRPPYLCPNQNAALADRLCVFVTSPIEPGDPCPAGFEVQGSVCSSTEPALRSDVSCPEGARGIAGACMVDVFPFPSIDVICVEGGFLTVAACVVYGDPVTFDFVCPQSATVFQDGQECYVLLAPLADGCPVGTTTDPGGLCRRQIDLQPVAATCDPDFQVFGTRCARFDAPVAEQVSCIFGAELSEAGACRQTIPDAAGDLYCENPGSFLQIDECIFTTAFGSGCSTAEAIAGECGTPVPACPIGYSPDDSLGGVCARFELASQRPPECPAGSLGDPGDCYILVAPGPDDGGACPAGTTLDASGSCRQPVDDATGAYFCEDPLAALNGKSCVFTAGFVTACDEFGNLCPDRPGDLVCPVSATVFVDGDQCFELVSFQSATCAAGTTDDPGSGLCRKPVQPVAGGLECPATFDLVDGQCLRFSLPVAAPTCGADNCDGELMASQNGHSNDGADTTFVTRLPVAIAFTDCAGGVATYVLAADDDVIVQGTLIEGEPGVYAGSYSVDAPGASVLTVVVDCPDGSSRGASEHIVFIDPSGVITDCVGAPVEGAQVTLLRADDDGVLQAVVNGDATVMDPAVNTANPSSSDDQGRYRWDVVAGTYQVSVMIDGQSAQSSSVLSVPPERTDVDFVFASLNCPPVTPTSPTTPRITSQSAPLPIPQIVTAPSNSRSPVAASVTTGTQAGLAVTGVESQALLSASIAMFALGLSGHVASRRMRRKPLES